MFVQVQRAWELVGTAEARAAYDRGHGFGAHAAPAWSGCRGLAPPSRPADTRPRARSFGQPGGWRRERYLDLIREWVGRGVTLDDPYDPALVRSAPQRAATAARRRARRGGHGARRRGPRHGLHRVARRGRAGARPNRDDKLDHIVLGPSGLYGVLSEDFGGPVGVRRGELIGDAVPGAPVAELLARDPRRSPARAGVRFGGAIVVLPDEDLAAGRSTSSAGCAASRSSSSSRSALSNVLRQGVTGARAIGGNEIFDVRTRLQQAVRFV